MQDWPFQRTGIPGPAALTGSDRQQTLAATVEWSCALLIETEQRLFDALGAFPASFDADAPVAVAAAAAWHGGTSWTA